MKKPILAILALILAAVACGQYVTPIPASIDTPAPYNALPSIIPTATQPPSLTAAPAETARAVTVQAAVVNIRSKPDGEVVGQIYAGQSVTILQCESNWCEIEKPAGWVWGGCLVGINDKGCEAKE